MLNKKLRVSSELFEETFKKSKTLSSSHLLLRFYKSARQGGENSLGHSTTGEAIFPSKFSITVPKSVSKKAVIRNLLKRRGYSIIRKLLVPSDLSRAKSREVEGKKIKNSYICIFSFKKGASTISFEQIKDEITLLLKKSQIKVD